MGIFMLEIKYTEDTNKKLENSNYCCAYIHTSDFDGYSNLEWVSPQGNMADELTRYHLSISHQNPSPEKRKRMSEGQKKRFARERATGTGRYSTQKRVSA